MNADATLARFALAGPVRSWERYGNGHINDTLLVHCDGADYIAQRLNAKVFPDGAAVMGNIARVLAHLEQREPDANRRLSLIPTRDGRHCLQDESGSFWRVYPFVRNTQTVERVQDPSQAHAAACAFARFLAQLADLPGAPLATVIPGFHDTPARLARLADAAAADPLGRLAEIADAVRWALDQRVLAGSLLAARDRGEIPEVATHNDTKINNILMAADGRTAQCIIDLDTLMPGLALYDFADLVRTASCRAPEDGNPADMVPDLGFLGALVDGWLEGRGSAASRAERELMPIAGAVITFECGVRFLTDHLLGDTYFKIKRPGHNRERGLAQLALARGVLARQNDLKARINQTRSARA